MLTAILLALAANPLPSNKSPIDSLTYTFGLGGGILGGGGSLSIAADGKVTYFYSSAPHTGSGGTVVRKEWELSKEERAELFRKLVNDGLLDAEEGRNFTEQIRVTSGRWSTGFAADKVPDKAMAHLRPLLSKAHPGLWPEKPAPKEVALKPGTLTSVTYHFSNAANGDHTELEVSRDGKVRYGRRSPNPAKPLETEWALPAKDAEALLDALVADGLFDSEEVRGDKFPLLTIHAQAGRWRTKFHPKELPEKVAKQLLPLVRKADPDFWK